MSNLTEKNLNEETESCKNIPEDSTNNDVSNTTAEQTQKINVKQLSFWLGLIAVLIVGVQLLLNYFGINFEAKIVIEVVSYVLALLVSVGVLKTSLKGKNIVETKQKVENELNDIAEDIANKTKSSKTK